MAQNHNSGTSKTDSVFDMKWNEADEVPPVTEYRTICVTGLLALLLGLLSPLVMISWGAVFLPILAMVLAFLALYSIEQSDGTKFGRPAAWAALFLSLCFIVLTFVLWETYKSRMVREAIEFGGSYFELVAREKDDPEIDLLKVRDMNSPYWLRSKASLEDRWRAIEKDMFTQEDLDATAGDECLRTLMALGQDAKATFYKVENYRYDTQNAMDYVTLVYAVTYPGQAGEKETFFVQLVLKRHRGEDTTTIANKKNKMGGWGVGQLRGPILPKEFGGDA